MNRERNLIRMYICIDNCCQKIRCCSLNIGLRLCKIGTGTGFHMYKAVRNLVHKYQSCISSMCAKHNSDREDNMGHMDIETGSWVHNSRRCTCCM